jgi:hypothetical protein
MAKYRIKCVGCGKKVQAKCKNCQKTNFIDKGNILQCVHCKKAYVSLYHTCRESKSGRGGDVFGKAIGGGSGVTCFTDCLSEHITSSARFRFTTCMIKRYIRFFTMDTL